MVILSFLNILLKYKIGIVVLIIYVLELLIFDYIWFIYLIIIFF